MVRYSFEVLSNITRSAFENVFRFTKALALFPSELRTIGNVLCAPWGGSNEEQNEEVKAVELKNGSRLLVNQKLSYFLSLSFHHITRVVLNIASPIRKTIQAVSSTIGLSYQDLGTHKLQLSTSVEDMRKYNCFDYNADWRIN